jgi:hypothetical protein
MLGLQHERTLNDCVQFAKNKTARQTRIDTHDTCSKRQERQQKQNTQLMEFVDKNNVRVGGKLWLEVDKQTPVNKPGALLQLMQRVLERLQERLSCHAFAFRARKGMARVSSA